MFQALNHYNNPKNVSTIFIPVFTGEEMYLGEVK